MEINEYMQTNILDKLLEYKEIVKAGINAYDRLDEINDTLLDVTPEYRFSYDEERGLLTGVVGGLNLAIKTVEEEL